MGTTENVMSAEGTAPSPFRRPPRGQLALL